MTRYIKFHWHAPLFDEQFSAPDLKKVLKIYLKTKLRECSTVPQKNEKAQA
jgi:hypothetical protein